ncbi:MAG: hypothetical protein V4719_05290 [Planctomycetota bacterium]
MRVLSSRCCYLLLTGCLVLGGLPAVGQEPRPERYFPLNTPLPPPGRAGDWAARAANGSPMRFQPVEVQLPVEGQVTWFAGGPAAGIVSPAPSMAGLLLGPVYRVKLSGMPEYPGVELYPTIEMVSRLHPPAGRANEFPVIIGFTANEIELAAQGQLVTKIIYLEQPNRASLQNTSRGKPVAPVRVTPRENPLEIADINGRPLAIVRLGGRVPDTNRPEPGFFGSGAPVQPLQRPAAATADEIGVPALKPPMAQPSSPQNPEVNPFDPQTSEQPVPGQTDSEPPEQEPQE